MATPTPSQPVSTPKHLLNTPRHLHSPRPGTATSSHRPSAGKSPAVKTPASLQGHGHHTSAISQPGSTPATAGGLHEDILGIKSPDASILAGLNATGLTPLPGAQDGLGISAVLSGVGSSVARNPEVERAQNLRKVVDVLQEHRIGRGITRHGVEKIAQAQGFTTLWDGNTLTIAGTKVDLEILFDGVARDNVKDVVFNLNVLDAEEPQLQQEASAILKRSLVEDDRADGLREPWKSMHEFSKSLRRLSELDHINTNINCFELIDDLSTALKRVWDEEKHRLSWRNDLQHLCRGSAGKPSLNEERIGLRLAYWQSRTQLSSQTYGEMEEPWEGSITCEAGAPFVIKPPQWLLSDVLSDVELDEKLTRDDITVPKPNWFPATTALSDTGNVLKVDKSETLDLRFVYKLDRPVHLPLGTAATMNAEVSMLELDQSKALSYQQAIQHGGQTSHSFQNPQQSSANRWTRSVDVFDSAGHHLTSSHSYCLYSIPPDAPLWCYPVRELRFSHPRQLLEALPLLRQYAMVWDLLRNLVPRDARTTVPQSTHNQQEQTQPTQKNTKISKRSNRKPEQAKLQALLEPSKDVRSTLLVDLSLDVVSDPTKVKIKVFTVMRGNHALQTRHPFLRLEIGVGQNGILSVEDLSGTDPENANEWKNKLEKRLRLCEDIGILLEWLLREMPKSTASRSV